MNHIPPREGGFSFIIVLWIIVVLAVVALRFSHVVTMEQRRCANVVSAIQAEQIIAAGIRYATALFGTGDFSGELPDEESALLEAVPVGSGHFWFLGRPGDDEEPGEEPGFGFVDESSKLNLNTATYDMLLGLPGMTAELAAAIIDWRDQDEEAEEGGAEAETYLRNDPAYTCKNSPFETVEELRLVNGADVDTLFGKDRNLNGIEDALEQEGVLDVLQEGSLPGELHGLLEYVTVWTRESTSGDGGNTKPNINDRQASSDVLELIREELGAEKAEQVSSSAQLGRTTYDSLIAFFYASGLTVEEFAKIADKITVSDEAYVEGLVNVNTASEAVLACLPGLEEEDARALVAYRVQEDSQTGSVAWITEVIDQEKAVQVGPHITTRISQVSADIVALGDGGRGFRRSTFILDVSGETPKVLHRRDRTALGWCLGPWVREEFGL